MNQPEKYLSVKELAGAVKDHYGMTVSPRFIRSMLKAGVPRFGFNARLSDLMSWWESNRDFAPRAKINTQIAA